MSIASIVAGRLLWVAMLVAPVLIAGLTACSGPQYAKEWSRKQVITANQLDRSSAFIESNGWKWQMVGCVQTNCVVVLDNNEFQTPLLSPPIPKELQ